MKQIGKKTEGQRKLTIGTQAGSSRTVGIALSNEMSDLRQETLLLLPVAKFSVGQWTRALPILAMCFIRRLSLTQPASVVGWSVAWH